MVNAILDYIIKDHGRTFLKRNTDNYKTLQPLVALDGDVVICWSALPTKEACKKVGHLLCAPVKLELLHRVTSGWEVQVINGTQCYFPLTAAKCML